MAFTAIAQCPHGPRRCQPGMVVDGRVDNQWGVAALLGRRGLFTAVYVPWSTTSSPAPTATLWNVAMDMVPSTDGDGLAYVASAVSRILE